MTENEKKVVDLFNVACPSSILANEDFVETFGPEAWAKIVEVIVANNSGPFKAAKYGDDYEECTTPGEGKPLSRERVGYWELILFPNRTLEIWPRGGGSGGAGPVTVNF